MAGGTYSPGVVLAELVLIGVVIYAILRFLQGTRGARLMRAVGMILLASFLVVRVFAQKFEFDRINFLYPYFLWAVLLATLVAFQPELRRGLIRLGELWGVGAAGKYAELIIEPLVTAVSRLAHRKFGAIIAIERGVPIGGLLESGVRLDAEVTAELLESLFWPGSTLHDMGVVVRRGRLAGAGCQFPLAESQDVDRGLGSRHRAALGLSQESDALVIVVSEETGTVSVAERGRLIRGMSRDQLQDYLRKALRMKLSSGAVPPEPAAFEGASPSAPAGDLLGTGER